MAITRCVNEFSIRLRKIPSSGWARELEKMPESCMLDCTAGGCRRHCGEFMAAQQHKLNHQPKQTKPPKTKAKGKK